MKNLFLFLVLVLTSNLGFSQPVGMISPFHSFQNEEINVVIDGHPYIDDAYSIGITTIQGTFGFRAPMRYNAGKNVMEFLDRDQIVREVLRRPYITIDLAGTLYQIIEYSDDGKEKLGYFNPLNQGRIQLLRMPKKELSLHRRISILETRAAYREASAYYIKKEGNAAVKLRLNKNNILILLFDKASEMNSYISNYGLNLRKEGDVIRLLDYYNSLVLLKRGEKEMQS